MAHCLLVERIERLAEAVPDRPGAGGRKLLAADDMREPDKAGLAPPERRHASALKDRLQPRVLLDQPMDSVFEIGLGVEVDGHCDLKPSRSAKEINAALIPARFPLRSEPERPASSRPCLFGAAQFRPRAEKRRTLPAAHRGYRSGAMPAGIRGGDLRGSGLARHLLGDAGAAAVGAFWRIRPRRRAAVGAGPSLSEFREPRRSRKTGGAAGNARRVAARPRRG